MGVLNDAARNRVGAARGDVFFLPNEVPGRIADLIVEAIGQAS